MGLRSASSAITVQLIKVERHSQKSQFGQKSSRLSFFVKFFGPLNRCLKILKWDVDCIYGVPSPTENYL